MYATTVRLNKCLANLGICARRDVKLLLKNRVITINGERAKEPGMRIDPAKDDIRLDGKKIHKPKHVYFLLNKPKGIVSTTQDEYGRKNVSSLIRTKKRIYPVGRLDKDTTGLIILTNDGALTNLLIHPKYHVDKTYRLTIKGSVDIAQLRALRNGVLLNDGITASAKVSLVKETNDSQVLEMTIHEGRNRQIRRMCETVGVSLKELQRIKFGPVSLGNLQEGEFRKLSQDEIRKLKNLRT
jgi:23S rRNA pseudouridine2605 synthase